MISPGLTTERKEELREKWGLNSPLIVRYIKWITCVVMGDLGYSTRFRQPVSAIINERLWNTLYLSLPSTLLSFLIAIPLGVLTAVKKNTNVDRIISAFSLLGISMPTFFFVLIALNIFAVNLQWLPSSGMTTAGSNFSGFSYFKDVFRHSVIPVAVYILISVPRILRYVKSSMLDAIALDCIRTARSLGMSKRRILYRHALINAMLPILTIIGSSFTGLFTGGLITETLLSWPGIGNLLMIAVQSRDYNLMMGICIILSIMIFAGNLLTDVLYMVVDPRIKK
jgi:peptide/nickel transport system permease protein